MPRSILPSVASTYDNRSRAECEKDALTDSFGWAVQILLASLAFACLVLKRFCEPRSERRTWLVWFYDTSKQGLGAMVIHFANIFLASTFSGDPCTWYLVSFLLDSSVGLLVIYAGIRLTIYLAERNRWEYLIFGEYGSPPSPFAWSCQCAIYMSIMGVEKILITGLIQLEFWDSVREWILSPITNPKLEIALVLLIVPFFVNVLMFWVTDNFLMRGHRGRKRSKRDSRNSLRHQRADKESEDEEDNPLLSGDDELLGVKEDLQLRSKKLRSQIV
ncbi:store-operated calcium entry regulator STIMATE-like isoform X1 [Artemia franciscana]